MEKNKLHLIKGLGGILLVLGLNSFAKADDITDSITEALEFYNQGNYQDAVENLTYASQLIQQKKGEGLKGYLPEPLEGWEADAPKLQASGPAGITVERRYKKGKGSGTIQIITDSPMMQGFMMMFSNPMFATGDGAKRERIEGQKAIVKYEEGTQRGNVKIMVANRYYVSVEARGLSGEDLRALAGAVDYKKLEAGK